MKFADIKFNKRNADERILTALLIVATLSATIWAGTVIECSKGQNVAIAPLFTGENKLTDIGFLTLPDILTAAVFSLPLGKITERIVTFAVFAVRGLAVGHTFCFCTVNSVSAAALGAVAAYCVVTLMFGFYRIYISDKKEMGTPARLLCYLTVSGAAVIIRTVPYLFC